MQRRAPRGFTIIELMIVVTIIGIISALAIPYYMRLTARSNRAEEAVVLSKLRTYFVNLYESQGTYATLAVPTGASEVNPIPTVPIGQPAPWSTTLASWKDIPFGADGVIRMRYRYVVTPPDQLVLEACGQFAGMGASTISCFGGLSGNYHYVETIQGSSTIDVTEVPQF